MTGLPNRRFFLASLAAMGVAMGAIAADANALDISFARGKWNPADFTAVKSWRWDDCGHFVQRDDAIVNHCPDVSGEEVARIRGGSTYAALVHNVRFALGTKVSSKMMFDHRMAPIIVLAEDLGRNEKTGEAEFRDHWEVCLYDQGVNLWYHYFENGEQRWFKAASLLLPEREWFKPNVKHDLHVTVSRVRRAAGAPKMITIEVGGYRISHVDDKLPDTFRAGVIACEGRNFFYDFRAETVK